jgi:hypothetical protein
MDCLIFMPYPMIPNRTKVPAGFLFGMKNFNWSK